VDNADVVRSAILAQDSGDAETMLVAFAPDAECTRRRPAESPRR
jgi:hypothetical protein